MQAIFIELPAFERNRERYLDEDSFQDLQDHLIANPLAGDVIKGTGGLRKLRWMDSRRNKGKRGGIRVIYYYFLSNLEFWLFTLYDKGEMSDLSAKEKGFLETMLRNELKARRIN